jgi:hypothetical protein
VVIGGASGTGSESSQKRQGDVADVELQVDAGVVYPVRPRDV